MNAAELKALHARDKWYKRIAIWFCMGMVYYPMEGLYRIPSNGGWAHISMMFVGMFCCAAACGVLNQFKWFYKKPVIVQSAVGSCAMLVVELLAGCILNLWLGFGIWDYSNLALNILGQVCPQFGIIWFCLMPLAIWLEDFLVYSFYRKGAYYTLWSIYYEFITLK